MRPAIHAKYPPLTRQLPRVSSSGWVNWKDDFRADEYNEKV